MAKKAIQDRILPEAPAPVRSAPKPKAAAPAKARGAGAFFSGGDYLRRVGDLKGIRDVQKEFGPRPKQTAYKQYTSSVGPFNRGPVPGGQGTVGLTHVRFTPTANAPKATVSGVYSDVNDRMMAHNKKLAAEAAAKKQAATPKKAAPIRTTVDMRITPAAAKAKAPARMAVNPRTGSTLGFTTGKTTGSTSFKPGVAAKTRVSPAQQMARNAFNKGGVAGPSRSGGGRSAGPSRSTSTPSRGDVGAGRRGGGR